MLCVHCGVRLPGQGLSPLRHAAASLSANVERPVTASPAELRDLPSPRLIFAVLLAITGGLFGILGAMQAELPSLLLAPFIWGPVAEEVLKPAGLYVMLIKWPAALRNRACTATLSAIAGIAFGLVESTIYVTVYAPEHSQAYLLFRFTVPVMLHAVASFVFGMGINRQLLLPLTGSGSFRASNWVFFLCAIVIHSSYNVVVTVLGVLDKI